MPSGKAKGTTENWSTLLQAAIELEDNRKNNIEIIGRLDELCRTKGLRVTARALGIDPGHLSAMLKGMRKLPGLKLIDLSNMCKHLEGIH